VEGGRKGVKAGPAGLDLEDSVGEEGAGYRRGFAGIWVEERSDVDDERARGITV
jgi:hypothetical protein